MERLVEPVAWVERSETRVSLRSTQATNQAFPELKMNRNYSVVDVHCDVAAEVVLSIGHFRQLRNPPYCF